MARAASLTMANSIATRKPTTELAAHHRNGAPNSAWPSVRREGVWPLDNQRKLKARRMKYKMTRAAPTRIRARSLRMCLTIHWRACQAQYNCVATKIDPMMLRKDMPVQSHTTQVSGPHPRYRAARSRRSGSRRREWAHAPGLRTRGRTGIPIALSLPPSSSAHPRSSI